MIETEAWVLYPGDGGLRREVFRFPDIAEHEVLVEPLYGCWEGNMTHAVERRPVDICRQRGEEKVVIGNAGVVRVLATGDAAGGPRSGDLCLVFCNGVWDELGYPEKIYGYDAPGSVGVLARRTKLHRRQLVPLPPDTRHSSQQWAAFSLRYITAWANWKVAYGCWRVHSAGGNGDGPGPTPTVWGWGGGVSLAELALARHRGCPAAMIASHDRRLELIRGLGITPIDRREFPDLSFDEGRYRDDAAYREAYRTSEESFLEIVRRETGGTGVGIFIDFIGAPVVRATLKALGRPGVVTTAGWKEGMNLSTIRAIECMRWHTHVHTHYARYPEAREAVDFAEREGWMPPLQGREYGWDEIPELYREHARGEIDSYFPIFRVNSP